VSDGKFDMAEDERVAEVVMGEVNLHKQEEDIAGESAAVAAHMSPLFETRPAPTIQHKLEFPAEEPKLEEIEGQGLHLNCLDELCTYLEAENCDIVMPVETNLSIGEGTHLNSCMKTLHAPSMQESCAYQAMKTASKKYSGESVDL